MSNQNKTANEITCEFVLKCAQKHGLTLSMEDKSWTVFVAPNGHKLCVSKTKGDAPKVDTTVDITSLPNVMARDGKQAPLNGRFVSLFVASPELIEEAIKTMGSGDGIRPVRRSKKAPVAFQLEETKKIPEGSLADIGAE